MVDFRTAQPEEIETIRALERASAQRFVGLMDALAADEPSPARCWRRGSPSGGLVVAVETEARTRSSWGS
jgi:Ser/Thr protein kinase RdoA (MazF antagonist)